jgi:hypothetical protein
MQGYSYIQWKIAMARMQDANMATSEITEQGQINRPATRTIAEYHLDRYFEMVEAELDYRRKLYGQPQWSPHTSTAETRHITASTSKPVRLIPAAPNGANGAMGSATNRSSHPQPVRCSMPSVPEVSQLFDDIMKAASKKAEPIVCNVVLMNAGRQTEVSMAIALALQYRLKNALA